MTSCHSLTRNTLALLLSQCGTTHSSETVKSSAKRGILALWQMSKWSFYGITLDCLKISRHTLIYLFPFWMTEYQSGWRVESISLTQCLSAAGSSEVTASPWIPSLLLWLPHLWLFYPSDCQCQLWHQCHVITTLIYQHNLALVAHLVQVLPLKHWSWHIKASLRRAGSHAQPNKEILQLLKSLTKSNSLQLYAKAASSNTK